MNTDAHGFIGVFYDVYNELGSGFLESVYIQALGLALDQAGFLVERETPLKVFFNFGPRPQIRRFLFDKRGRRTRSQ
jgi:GxxExxY protein